MGHSVARANSVASAVAVLTREQFDVIISDIGLPDGNGIPLIYAVREFCHVPAIALTGYGNPEDIERSLSAGFNRHLTKPVSFETLRQTIAKFVPTRLRDSGTCGEFAGGARFLHPICPARTD